MSVRVRVAAPSELPLCHAVRHAVFVLGQDVPPELEIDGLDPVALHLLALHDDTPVGTARLRDVHGHAKIERVAVLAAHRGEGLGLALMHTLHAEAVRLGYTSAELHAQVQVVPFYEALGYVAHGERFLDAGIWHLAMTRDLP